MTFYVTTGHPLGKYRYSVPTGYSRYGSYSSRLSDPLKGYSSSGSSYSTPYIPKTSYSTPYVSRSSLYTPKSYTSSYTPKTYSRPSYLTNSKLWSSSCKPAPTYSEPRSNYSRTLKPLSDTFDKDYSYLKKSAPIDLPRAPKRDVYSNYSSNKYLVRPKMMPLSDVSFKWTVSRYRGHLNDYLSWR